jgi:hypothetical protein
MNNNHGYPNPLAPESQKDSPEYGLQYFRAMYQDWAGENNVLLESRRLKWQTSRDYAGGKQNVQQYKDLLAVQGDQSYINLDWSIVPILPKFVDIVVNSLTNADYTVKATAIDPVATDKRKADELKMRTRMLMKDFYKEIEMLSGLPISKDSDYEPADRDDLELYMQLTYKQAVEIAIEQGLKLAMSINDWKEIAKRVIRDLVVLGMGAVKTEVDHRGVIIRYVDPMYLVTTYSDDNDFTNISHAGEIKRITLSALKAEAGNQIEQWEYEKIAKEYAGKHGNAKKFRTTPLLSSTGFEYYDYDSFLVDVLDAQFITPMSRIDEKKYNAFGGYSINKRKEGYKLPRKSKYPRELIVTDYECKYIGKLVLGTDIVYDYGKAKNQIRAKSSLHKTKLDYIIYAPDIDFMKNQSLCERMIPFANQLQLVHLKLQHLVAKARPKGMSLEIGSLENVPKGKGQTFTPLELQEIYDQTGNYYYRVIDDEGNPSSARPITELEGGLGRSLSELLALKQDYLQSMRDVTGVNEARDGNVPSKDSVVGVAKLNLLASNNATRAINDAYLNITRRMSESAILMIQDLVKYHKPYQGYVHAIGEQNMSAIEVTRDVSLHEFGIEIQVEPNEEDKAYLEQNIQASLTERELRIEDAAMIREIKNVKLANQMLILRRKKYAEDKMKEAQMNAQMNAQQNQIATQQKYEADKAMKMLEVQAAAETLAAEYQLKERFAQSEHMRKMREIEAQNQGKVDVAEVNNEQKS